MRVSRRRQRSVAIPGNASGVSPRLMPRATTKQEPNCRIRHLVSMYSRKTEARTFLRNIKIPSSPSEPGGFRFRCVLQQGIDRLWLQEVDAYFKIFITHISRDLARRYGSDFPTSYMNISLNVLSPCRVRRALSVTECREAYLLHPAAEWLFNELLYIPSSVHFP